MWKERLKKHRLALFLLLLLFAVRLAALHELGARYTLWSDDASYVNSGIRFMETGMITIHSEWPSAQIMPGMPVLIALVARLFGTGHALWLALKLLWISMGTLAAWFLYRSVSLFTPRWCAALPMLLLLRPDLVWMDNLVLTETPYMLALSAGVYCTLKLGKSPSWPAFWGLAAAFMAAFLLRANILVYLPFAIVYLLLSGYDKRLLLKQSALLALVLLCFLLPWTARNYARFHAFIPVTYGAGNPLLLGTYQGHGYPADEELDYAANVDAVVRETYRDYYGTDGQVQPRYQQYVSLARDGIMAKYRQKVWWQRDKAGFLRSYLVSKPAYMVRSVFYWQEVFGIEWEQVILAHRLTLLLSAMAAALALLLRRYRAQVLLLLGTYVAHIYMYAAGFAFDRYNAPLQWLLLALAGLGLHLMARLVQRQKG